MSPRADLPSTWPQGGLKVPTRLPARLRRRSHWGRTPPHLLLARLTAKQRDKIDAEGERERREAETSTPSQEEKLDCQVPHLEVVAFVVLVQCPFGGGVIQSSVKCQTSSVKRLRSKDDGRKAVGGGGDYNLGLHDGVHSYESIFEQTLLPTAAGTNDQRAWAQQDCHPIRPTSASSEETTKTFFRKR